MTSDHAIVLIVRQAIQIIRRSHSKFVFIRAASESEHLSRISPLDDQEPSRLLVVPCFELESGVPARSLLSGSETASATGASGGRVSWNCCLLAAVSAALCRLVLSDQRVNPLISGPRFAPSRSPSKDDSFFHCILECSEAADGLMLTHFRITCQSAVAPAKAISHRQGIEKWKVLKLKIPGHQGKLEAMDTSVVNEMKGLNVADLGTKALSTQRFWYLAGQKISTSPKSMR